MLCWCKVHSHASAATECCGSLVADTHLQQTTHLRLRGFLGTTHKQGVRTAQLQWISSKAVVNVRAEARQRETSCPTTNLKHSAGVASFWSRAKAIH